MTTRFITRAIAVLGVIAGAAMASQPVHAQAREEARVLVATQVLEELRDMRDQNIPDWLLDRAYGVALIPDVKKGALGFGARFGRGIIVVRGKDGRFSHPAFLTLSGGGFGWQIGVQETDVVLVFTTKSGIEGISGGKLTLGGDASVAAGPVGRAASASTDQNLAEIFSYSRNRGLFAGVSLEGTALTIDRNANGRFYGNRAILTADIFSGTATRDSENVRRLLAALATLAHTNREAPPAPAATPAAAPAAVPASSTGGEARTFPMEDAKPGSEPPK